jgi:hypothetical protein
VFNCIASICKKKNLGCGLAGKCVYSKAIAKYHVLWFKCVG